MKRIDWEYKLNLLWSVYNELRPANFVEQMQSLVAELPSDDAIGVFELASANDSTGQEALAAPLYRRALVLGLSGIRRRRAIIQLASTLRNLGEAHESVSLLRAELHTGSDELNDAVKAFLALSLIDTGNEKEAAAIALTVVAPHLVRYNQSLNSYAMQILNSL